MRGAYLYDNVEVDNRVQERHPELSEADVLSAWCNAFVIVERSGVPLPDSILVAVGLDTKNRLIEMVGSVLGDGTVHVFHAMTPPSSKTFQEVGMG